MKKKITMFVLLFTIIFSSSVFAKTFDPVDNVDPHKVWTVTFDRTIEAANIIVLDKSERVVLSEINIEDNKALVTTFFDYLPGTYTLKVRDAKAKDGTLLKETTDFKFTVK